MAHAIWSGAISFGLVAIPVKLFAAVRETADIRFHFLHGADKGRIHNERVCSVCGKTVPWKDVVRGYEYEKGEFVALSEEELDKASAESTQTVDIVEFVDIEQIDPILYDKPYYLVPDKKGAHAYALLRDTLAKSKKVGIARVVLRSKEHLAALKPNGSALILEMMHWAEEIIEPSTLELPKKTELPASETKAAMMLIETMSARFDAAEFKDRHKKELKEIIKARVDGQPAREKAKPAATKGVVDLLDALKRSLADSKSRDGNANDANPKPAARSRTSPKRARASGKRAA